MAPNEPWSAQLDDIQKAVESIDGTLGDQVSSVDGVNYIAKLSHMNLVHIKDRSTTIATMATLTFLATLAAAVTVVAHVIHHW